MKYINTLLLALLLMTNSTSHAATAPDFSFIDQYLNSWDQFSNGKNELVPYLREKKVAFQASLASAVRLKDKKAPARLVFYTVVQVGGGVEIDSDLGHAAATLLGPTFPVVETKEGKKVYFAGDLFAWWQKNRASYVSMPLFDEWMQRDFAKQVVIPMYESAAKNAKQ